MSKEPALAAEVEEEVQNSPGETLRLARLQHGFTVDDVAEALNLAPPQIMALEEDRYGQLPGKTYVLGYMKSYARLVGVDEQDVFRNFDLREDVTIRGLKPVVRETKPGKNKHTRVWGVLAFAVIGVLAFVWWQSQDSVQLGSFGVGNDQGNEQQSPVQVINPAATPAQTQPGTEVIVPELNIGRDSSGNEAGDDADAGSPEAELQAQIAAESNDGNAAAPDSVSAGAEAEQTEVQGAAEAQEQPESSAVAEAGREITLDFSASSWVDVRDSAGNKLVYENINQGRQLAVEGSPPFSVFLGNAAGVSVVYEGKPFDFSDFTNGVYARFELGAR